jgi:hypothetical protein
MRKQNYDKDAMLIAVRRSLRGEAGMVAMRIDLDVNIDDIIRKLDSIYGSVDRKEILLTQFYGARQEKDEDISHWSCRLERIIGKCVDGGLVHHSEVDQQLHFMLWNGLKASLKAISGYKYDTIKDFDGLRVALRQIENYVPQESTSTSKPHISKAVTGQSEFDEIKGMIQQLSMIVFLVVSMVVVVVSMIAFLVPSIVAVVVLISMIVVVVLVSMIVVVVLVSMIGVVDVLVCMIVVLVVFPLEL